MCQEYKDVFSFLRHWLKHARYDGLTLPSDTSFFLFIVKVLRLVKFTYVIVFKILNVSG